jgi:hypothetical protein
MMGITPWTVRGAGLALGVAIVIAVLGLGLQAREVPATGRDL